MTEHETTSDPKFGRALIILIVGFWTVVLGAFFMGLAQQARLPTVVSYGILALGTAGGLTLMFKALVRSARTPKGSKQ